MQQAFQIHPSDNVATLLCDASAGAVRVLGRSEPLGLALGEPIALGHKVALCDIVSGGAVLKYGAQIGIATQFIPKGDWVHLHNCRSALDERSSTLDVNTGAATDTPYV